MWNDKMALSFSAYLVFFYEIWTWIWYGLSRQKTGTSNEVRTIISVNLPLVPSAFYSTVNTTEAWGQNFTFVTCCMRTELNHGVLASLPWDIAAWQSGIYLRYSTCTFHVIAFDKCPFWVSILPIFTIDLCECWNNAFGLITSPTSLFFLFLRT